MGGHRWLVAGAAVFCLTVLAPLGAAAPSAGEATLSPTALAFPDRPVGTRSDARLVTLTNTGTAPLAISTVRLTGPDAGDFGQGVDCPIAPDTLAVGASCRLYVSFYPSSTGPKSATLEIGDNAPSSPQTVALSGGGIAGGAGVVTLSRSSLTFRDQVVGTKSEAQDVTLTNTGTGPLTISTLGFSGPDGADFSQGVDCPISPDSLPAGGHCEIYVAFTPSSNGSRSATLAIGDDDPSSPQRIALSGSGTVGMGVATLSPSSLEFGNAAVGTRSEAQLVTLTNSGAGPLTISTLRINGPDAGDFGQGVDCPINPNPLPAGGSCHVYVSFAPRSGGPKSATIAIGDDDPSSPQTIALSGTGVTGAQATVVPTALDFGSQDVGSTSAPQTVTLTNTGGGALAIASVSASGDFAQTNNCPATLAAGANCSASVTFRPGASGARSGTLSFADDAPGAPHTTSLTGTGTQPPTAMASLSPSSLSFGDQQVGTQSAPRTVTLTNTGTLGMSISSIATTGDFTRTTTCAATLAPGASCTIAVTFSPTAAGTRTSTLSVTSNAVNSPTTAALSGNGTMPLGTFLTDGFENGLTGWTTTGLMPPGIISVGPPAHTGTKAVQMSRAGSGLGLLRSFAGQGQPQTHTRFYLSPGNQFASELAQGTDANGQPTWEIDYDPRVARMAIYVWNNARVRTDVYVNNPFSGAGAWSSFDIDLYQAVAGHFYVTINGNRVATVNSNFSTANNYSRLSFWDYSDYGAIGLDDVSVSVS